VRTSRLLSWRTATAVLLCGAAVGAVGRGANASFVGRLAGVLAAGALVAVAIAVMRERDWGWGAAFLIGICWSWATIALRVQGVLQPGEVAMWLAWSVTVVVASVRGRTP